MELKDFVKETLVQISLGVKEAQEIVRAQGGYVNPATRVSAASDKSHFGHVEDGQNILLVDFDVAIEVSEETGKGAEAKLKIASLYNVAAGGKRDSSSLVTNKISFQVPLAPPVDAVSKKKLLENERRINAETEELIRRRRDEF